MIPVDGRLSETIRVQSGEPVQRCYYCQKCSLGCPTAYAMDKTPAQVLKMVQLGQLDELLTGSSIWLCVGCETCGARCPNGIRINNVMDALKKMTLEKGISPAEPEVLALHTSFVESIRRFGRVHELTMILSYKLRTPRKILNDLGWSLKLFAKGKALHLWQKIQDLEKVRDLFTRSGV